MKTAIHDVEVDGRAVPTTCLVSLEVDHMVHCLLQLAQKGIHIPLLISSTLSAIVIVVFLDLVRPVKTMQYKWADPVELAVG